MSIRFKTHEDALKFQVWVKETIGLDVEIVEYEFCENALV